MKKLSTITVIAALLAVAPLLAREPGDYAGAQRLTRQIHHELVMMPYYSVFDHIQFQVLGNKVVLSGEVSRPTLKTTAERLVQRIEGVAAVENRIKVLPLSRFDDRIRIDVYRSLYRNEMLSRYSLGSVPSIHIIVNNGDVTLEGVVAREAEKTVAGMMANQVGGVFSVTNNLRVERTS